MPFYQITNVSGSTHTSTSLTLDAGLSTTMNVPSLPIDLNDAIVAKTLVVVRLGSSGGGGGGGSVDVETEVIEDNVAASTNSQEIVASQASRLPPGIEITNNTTGDIAIRCSASAAAFINGQFDKIVVPGETVTIAADYLDAVQCICKTAVGTIGVKVYH